MSYPRINPDDLLAVYDAAGLTTEQRLALQAAAYGLAESNPSDTGDTGDTTAPEPIEEFPSDIGDTTAPEPPGVELLALLRETSEFRKRLEAQLERDAAIYERLST